MTTTDERRADGIHRVPVEALVEVCGVGGKVTPFEAESADVSGRGIRLRTAYLPEAGAPVVCRFENAGREVIAEGVVAWCQSETRGGEFGVRFTALDAQSAEILRDLCGIADDGSVVPPLVDTSHHEPRQAVATGAKVKLHIEGLGSPMRARVDDGKKGQIAVGSSLEFLRIGRKLELESVDDGKRHQARIDGLDVMIDPSTGVPRLLVLLKTQSEEDTPQPSVVDASRRTAQSKVTARSVKDQPTARENTAKVAARSNESADEPTDEQVDAMVGQVRRLAGVTRRKVSEVTIQISERLGPSVGRAFDRVRQLSRRPTEAPRRRTTSAPVGSDTSTDRKLRPQNRASQPDQEPERATSLLHSPRMRKAASGVVAAGLLATVVAVAMRDPAPTRSDVLAATDSVKSEPTLGAVPGSPAVGAQGMPGQLQPSASSSLGNSGLTAQVPLFGPTTMATLERAPVGVASTETAVDVAVREQALAKATAVAVAGGVDAAKISEEPSAEASEQPSAKPEDVAPFGHGKMKDPILYRLKLDAPGEALKGTSSGKGFAVTIPGRKLLESPKGFVKRDPRFEKIFANSSADGAKLTWQFKHDAPAFRVRLRKSNIEILISEDGKSSK